MFTAKPKLNNRLCVQEFESLMAAVEYLNNYNEMGPKFKDDRDQFVPAMKAEDWWLLGKLTGPEGVEFRDNKMVMPK